MNSRSDTTPSISTDPSLCPLCAGPNECAMVNGGKTCWCFSAPIAREAIERVPPESRGIACICQKCGCTIDRVIGTAEDRSEKIS